MFAVTGGSVNLVYVSHPRKAARIILQGNKIVILKSK